MTKSHTMSFHILVWTYHSDMHIEVFKNAYISKTTHVCTFQSLPSGLTCKGFVFERHVKFGNGGRCIFHYFSVQNSNILKLLRWIVLFSDKAITPGDNHISFETNWQLYISLYAYIIEILYRTHKTWILTYNWSKRRKCMALLQYRRAHLTQITSLTSMKILTNMVHLQYHPR